MIEEVKLKLFSDRELTHQEAEFIASGVISPQTIEMTNLNSATTYYAVAYATDGNGVTGQSEPSSFRTRESFVSVRGQVDFTMHYDTLKYVVYTRDDERYTLVAEGVEFCTFMDFHNNVQTFYYTGDGSQYQNASPFEAHTLYYYRFFAEYEEIGRIYEQPGENYITTMYAMPVFNIYTNNVGENNAEVTITYTGDYPIDYNSLRGSVVGATGDIFTLQLDALTPTHPETITLSGLNAGTLYEVEVWMNYYTTTAEAYETFTTAESTVHNFDIRISPTWNVDYHIIDIDVIATKIAFGRFTYQNIGIDICAVPDFSGHQLGGELGSGALTFTWEATGLNEHKRYFCRPWIETLEAGREYGETKIVESHWDIPEITITQSDEGWNSVLLSVKYNGGLPVPNNGVIKIYSADMQTLVTTVSASDLVWNGIKQVLVTGLQTHTTYNAVYEGAYYSFGNLVTGSAEIYTSAQRIYIERTESWDVNGEHTDVFTVNVGLGDLIDEVNFLYPLGIDIESQTSEDNVYTVVTQGYSYGNPYQLSAEVVLVGGYTESQVFGITVPSQKMTPTRTQMAAAQMPYPNKRKIVVTVDTRGSQFNFDYDFNNSYCVFEETTTHEQYTAPLVALHYGDTQLETAGVELPVGHYLATNTVANVVHQSYTATPPTNILVWNCCFISYFSAGRNQIQFNVYWNTLYNNVPTKTVDLMLNDVVIETKTVSGDSQLTFSNLTSNTEYTFRFTYDPNEEPQYFHWSTDPSYQITSVDATQTNAIINIQYS